MSLLTQDALDEEHVSDEELLAAVPDRPVSSVRDIQMIYGALVDLATATDEEYGPYLTPMAAAEFADTGDDSLVIIDVDVTESEPSCEGVTVKRLAEDEIPKLGLSYYASRGSGIDHSIAHRTGKDVDREKIAKYTMQRLTRWTDEDAVRAYADSELPEDNLLDRLHVFAEHADDLPDPDYPDVTGGLADVSGVGDSTIENMREAGLGDVTDVKEASIDELKTVKGVGGSTAEKIMAKAEESDLEDDDDEADGDAPSLDDESIVNQLMALRQEAYRQVSGTTPAIITVRVRTEPNGEFRWPSEVSELMDAMYAQYRSKMSTKGMTDPEKRTPAVGRGVDYVTNEPDVLVGTPEDPLVYYTSKQREKYPGLDITEGWRLHQLSFENAARLSKSDEFVDACGQRVVSSVVYYLPYYPGEPNAEDLRGLYQILHGLVEDDDDASPLVRAYENAEEHGIAEDLRFYMTITDRSNNNRYDVFGETVAETTLWPFELARAHKAVLDSPQFGHGGEAFNVAAHYDSDDKTEEEAEKQRKSLALLDHELEALDLTSYITTGWYLIITHPEDRPKKDGQWEVSEADRRLRMLRTILAGDQIAIESLLDAYVERLNAAERGDSKSDSTTLIMAQFAQWCALARCGLLKTESGDDTLLSPTVYMTDSDPTSDDAGLSSADDSLAQYRDGDGDAIDADVDIDVEHERFRTESGDIDYRALDAADSDELTDAEKGLLRTEKRRAALEQFILSSPVLRDSLERRGMFLLGGLIAQLSNYQRGQDRGSTLSAAFPASAITPDVAERAHTEAMEKAQAYRDQQHASSLFYGEYYKPLATAFTKAPPENWETSQSQLQFYYGLGISYGNGASYGLDEIDLDELYDEIDRLQAKQADENSQHNGEDESESQLFTSGIGH